jgi:hypothetical protein
MRRDKRVVRVERLPQEIEVPQRIAIGELADGSANLGQLFEPIDGHSGHDEMPDLAGPGFIGGSIAEAATERGERHAGLPQALSAERFVLRDRRWLDLKDRAIPACLPGAARQGPIREGGARACDQA